MTKARAVTQISVLWAGTFVGAAIAFATQVLLARRLSTSDYGDFAAVFAIVSLASAFGGFGIQGFLLSVFGKEGEVAKRWLPASFRFAFLTILLAILGAIWWGAISGISGTASTLLLFMLPYIAGQSVSEIVTGKYQIESSYITMALWQLMPHICRLGGIMLLLTMPVVGIVSVGAIYGSVAVLFAAVGSFKLAKMCSGVANSPVDKSTEGGSAPGLKDVFTQCWAFGAAAIFYFCYLQSGTIMLHTLAGAREAAIFNVAFMVLTAVYLFPSVVYQKFLMPKLHRWANHDRLTFYRVYREGNIAMAGTGIIAMVCVWGVADRLTVSLFGEEYRDVGDLLDLLAVCIPIRFVATSTGAALVTGSHMRRKVAFMGCAAGLNILVGVLVIPHYGVTGAVFAIIAGEGLLLWLYSRAVKMYVFADRP